MSASFESFLELFEKACAAAGRDKTQVQILPVSKSQSMEKVQEYLAIPGFPQELAENYLEELSEKKEEIPQVKWHYQGALQSRKVKEVLEYASVIQSVSRMKELEIIAAVHSTVEIYLQVNISSEEQKLGASFDEIKEMLSFATKEELNFVGFMGVASEISDSITESHVRKQFERLRKFRDETYTSAKLSMGMSGDFHLAIKEGADIIRVGSLIFGERRYT